MNRDTLKKLLLDTRLYLVCAHVAQGIGRDGYVHRPFRRLNRHRQQRPEEGTAPGCEPSPFHSSASGRLFSSRGRDGKGGVFGPVDGRVLSSGSAGGGKKMTGCFCLVIPCSKASYGC